MDAPIKPEKGKGLLLLLGGKKPAPSPDEGAADDAGDQEQHKAELGEAMGKAGLDPAKLDAFLDLMHLARDYCDNYPED